MENALYVCFKIVQMSGHYDVYWGFAREVEYNIYFQFSLQL